MAQNRKPMNRKNLQKPKDTFARNTTIVVIAVIVAIVLIVVFINNSSKVDASDNAPKNTINDGFVIQPNGKLQESAGYKLADEPKATDVKYDKDNINVTMYVDYDCPHCFEFDKAVGPTIDKMLEDGDIATVSIMPVSYQTPWSVSMQNIAGCVANYQPEIFQDVNRELMLAHETRPDKTVLYSSIAESSGTKLSADTQKCINSKEFNKWVETSSVNAQTGVYPPAKTIEGIKGTPSIFINGEAYNANPDANMFEAAIKHVADGGKLSQDSPEASVGG